MRILVIDDDELVRASLDKTLRSLGHEPVLTTGALEGIERAECETFDVALIDMNMPGPDGLEAVKAIARLPVQTIAMSGGSSNTELEYSVVALRMGARAFLPKPFTRKLLATTLEAVIVPAKR